jgi:hypothetical protein
MRNQYAGDCYRCGLPVPAGTGYFEKVRREDREPGDKAWRVQHCYRSHNGGITCEMAAEQAKKETLAAHTSETQQFGCVR